MKTRPDTAPPASDALCPCCGRALTWSRPALTDLERRRQERRLKTALKRPGVWVTGPLTRRKLYLPTDLPTTRRTR